METEVIGAITQEGMPDFTVLGMFLSATLTVKVVMLVLLLASIWSWAIIVEKSMKLRAIRGKADKFEEAFWSGRSLDDLFDKVAAKPDHPMALLFTAAMREWRRAGERGGISASIPERVRRVMSVTMNREMERLERYLSFLATVGSTAPFVGLFGTVWGIMNSFQSIAVTQNTSLAVVAPGIAEALFATALGLVAAIPAVVAYNKISGDLARYANRMEGFSEEFSAILERQLEEGS